jgi:hypothetical protein
VARPSWLRHLRVGHHQHAARAELRQIEADLVGRAAPNFSCGDP